MFEKNFFLLNVVVVVYKNFVNKKNNIDQKTPNSCHIKYFWPTGRQQQTNAVVVPKEED